GKATVHSVWGRTFALLTGDYLFTKVYELMAPYGADYNMIMSEACTRLVEGETLQAYAAKQGTIDRETYKRIIALKTASLFEASAHMGARLATEDENTIASLSSYAYNLGITFQLVDDILDIIGDPEDLGKPVGNDLLQGRGVLAVSNGLDRRNDARTTTVADVAVQDRPDAIEQMMANLRESGALELVRLQAVESAERARQALIPLPPTSAKSELLSLVDLVLDRHK
ncbi:MAG: polyprenyl synthetase family protein, partial [Candidatus Promineifilaceae bacterium]